MPSLDDLFSAVAAGDGERAAALVAGSPALARAKNAESLSILQFARYMRQPQILDMLITAGPPLDLFEAAQLDLVTRVRELLDGEPDLTAAFSADGFTALHFAAYYGALETMRVLLERGASTEAVTKNFLENMPIHAAAAGRRAATYEACALLLKAGGNVNARQHGGYAALHMAAQHGDRELAELFLSYGADATVKNDEGKTPADLAASQGNVELAALLRTYVRPH